MSITLHDQTHCLLNAKDLVDCFLTVHLCRSFLACCALCHAVKISSGVRKVVRKKCQLHLSKQAHSPPDFAFLWTRSRAALLSVRYTCVCVCVLALPLLLAIFQWKVLSHTILGIYFKVTDVLFLPLCFYGCACLLLPSKR